MPPALTSAPRPLPPGLCLIALMFLLVPPGHAADSRAPVDDPRFSDANAVLQPAAGERKAPETSSTARLTNSVPGSTNVATAGDTAAGLAAGSTNAAAPDTNSFSTMDTLDDKHKLAFGDRLSFRIVEDQEDPRETLDPKPVFVPFLVTDSGDVEVPYIGRYAAVGKTCKRLAAEIKTALEKKYYYQATVIIALDQITKSTSGRVYVAGQVRATGAVEIPADENFTLSKAVLRAGGFTEYADKRHVKVSRQNDSAGTNTVIINVSEILEKGKTEHDMKLEAGDFIFVPTRVFTF